METTVIDAPPADQSQKSGQDRILNLSIDAIRPSPENDKVYRPIDPDDPAIVALSESIREDGVREPLIVTRDGWIVSGHRRYTAARLAGLTVVPCRILPFTKDEDPNGFMKLLVDCNRQRVKTFDDVIREEVLLTNPEEAYTALVSHRSKRSLKVLGLGSLEIRGEKRRSRISSAKKPFLEAVKQIVEEWEAYWPLSDRRIHYALLNDPPLIHARKPNSVYSNTLQSYKALTDLLTRARLVGHIPMEAIADTTRPVVVWNVHRDVGGYLKKELDDFLKGYWRDLMQSQPNHIEIIGEKNTIEPIIRPIAARYTIPLTIGRGYCSLPPRAEIADRYERSGKDRLVLLILSDFDPDGQEIAHSLARSLRDDFGIYRVEAIKVALTADQVEEFDLPPMMQAKRTSTNYNKFAAEHGDDVFELEALEPKALQKLLRDAIDAVIDVEAFNHELDREKKDAAALDATRRQVQCLLSGITTDESGPH